MPKMKTRKAAAKRFMLTGNNKIMHYSCGMSHLLEHESSKPKRHRRGKRVLNAQNNDKVRKMLGV